MSDYRQSVREFILASRNVLELNNLSDDEAQEVRETLKRLLTLLDEEPGK